MVQIYILALSKGKYYVGKTNNLESQLEEHFAGRGSSWTSKYLPIKLLEVRNDCDDYDEDKYTLMYMDRYGIDNVRGGSYDTIKLDEFTRKHLEKISKVKNEKCSTCAESKHLSTNCPINLKYLSILREEEIKAQQMEIQEIELIPWEIKYQEDLKLLELKRQAIMKNTQRQVSSQVQESRRKVMTQEQNNICYRCEKKGHYRTHCHETRNIRGQVIDDSCVIS